MTQPVSEQKPYCFVFFVAKRTKPIRSITSLGWRLAFRAGLVETIALLGQSDLVHVCIGDGRAVLDQSLRGPRYFEATTFAMNFPRLQWAFVVPTRKPVDMDAAHHFGPISPLKTIIRWFTGGLTRSNDCVSATVAVLASGGVRVPRSIVTPIQLFTWMMRSRFELIVMEETSAPFGAN